MARKKRSTGSDGSNGTTIEKRGNQRCVVDNATGETLRCFPKAKKRRRARKAPPAAE